MKKNSIDNNSSITSSSATTAGKSWLEIIREHRAEFIIATSTTMVMAQIPLQGFAVTWLRQQPWVMADIKKYEYLFHLVRAPLFQVILYLVIPLLTMLIFRTPWREYGLRLGDFRQGLIWVVACIGVLAPFLYWASRMPDFARYYQGNLRIGFGWLALQYGLYMLAWEFLFRGYLYFPLEERTGATLAIFIQSIPFAVAHLGKPPLEAVTCYFGGLVLGYISYKTRSFIYAFLIHWGIYVALLGFIAIGVGASSSGACNWLYF